jgi:Uma2 family endonuclease
MAAVVPAMHTGPWTERDLLGLAEDGQRHELLEGSLVVSPPPAGRHQHAATQLELILIAAAPRGLDVVQGLGVRLIGGSVFVPDVLVAEREAVTNDRSGILASDQVHLVVEIVSPSSVTLDRVTKPQLYARARIPSFWRVELEEEGPRIETFRLRGRSYLSDGWACAGEELVVEKPFPLSFDPARLA